jgi:hypothetical protein
VDSLGSFFKRSVVATEVVVVVVDEVVVVASTFLVEDKVVSVILLISAVFVDTFSLIAAENLHEGCVHAKDVIYFINTSRGDGWSCYSGYWYCFVGGRLRSSACDMNSCRYPAC